METFIKISYRLPQHRHALEKEKVRKLIVKTLGKQIQSNKNKPLIIYIGHSGGHPFLISKLVKRLVDLYSVQRFG